MTLASCFTDIDQVVIAIADGADGGTADDGNHSHLAGGQTKCRVLTFLGHQLSCIAGCADHLAALTRMKLDIVDHGTNGDQFHRQAISPNELLRSDRS